MRTKYEILQETISIKERKEELEKQFYEVLDEYKSRQWTGYEPELQPIARKMKSINNELSGIVSALKRLALESLELRAAVMNLDIIL